MSMLPLTSKESLVAAHYSKGTSSMVSVERIGERGSTPLLRFFCLDFDEFDYIYAMAFSSDCARIALVLRSGDIYILDADSGEIVLGPLEGHTSFLNPLAFSPDGTRIVSGSDDHTIRSWNATNGESIAGPFEGHTDEICSVAFSPILTRWKSHCIWLP